MADGLWDEVEWIDAGEGLDAVDVAWFADGVVDDGSIAPGEFEVQPERLEDEQDIGEEDGGVDAELFGGGDGDLGGEFGGLAELEEPDPRAQGSIFKHITTCLAHEPDGRDGRGLAPAGAEEGAVVEQRVIFGGGFGPGAGRGGGPLVRPREVEGVGGEAGGFGDGCPAVCEGLDEVSHFGVFGDDVGVEVGAGECFVGGGADAGEDDLVGEGLVEGSFEAHLASDVEEVCDLLRGGEECRADVECDEGTDGAAECDEVVGEGPAVDGDAGDVCALVCEGVGEFVVRLSVFLDGDAATLKGARVGEGGEEVAPGIGFGRGESDGHAPFAHDGLRFGTPHNDVDTAERVGELVEGVFGLDRLGQVACADAGEKDDEVEVAGDEAVGEREGFWVGGDWDFFHGGNDARGTALSSDEFGHGVGHAVFEGDHAQARERPGFELRGWVGGAHERKGFRGFVRAGGVAARGRVGVEGFPAAGGSRL